MSTKARRAAKKAWIKKHKLLRKKLRRMWRRKQDRLLAGLPAFCSNVGDHGEALEGERAFYTNSQGEIIREEYEPPEGYDFKTWQEEVKAKAAGKVG